MKQTKLNEVKVGTIQVLEAFSKQGHNVIGRETLDFSSLDALSLYEAIPKKTKRIVVIYLD